METATFSVDGNTYQPEFDLTRLKSQAERVHFFMTSHGDDWWRTLREIASVAGGSEAGVSARLRDFRKKKWGGWIVDRRRRGDPKLGIWEYRVRGRG
jgi:hypothetical protein